MRLRDAFLAIAMFCGLVGCSIKSDVLLPDPTGAGDVIAGLPSHKAFRLEAFDNEKGAFKAFATLTLQKEGDAVRYAVVLDDGTPNRLSVQARKMSEGNYLVRFSDIIDGVEPGLDASALAFVTVKDGTYHLLSSLSGDGWLEEIFKDQQLPRGAGTSTVNLDTMDQAAKISAWFASNYTRLAERSDHIRFRLAR